MADPTKDESTKVVSMLLSQSDEISEKATIEWKHSLALQLSALGSSKTVEGLENLPSSNWIEFRRLYEQWYRACIELMDECHFSGKDDFINLYQEDHPNLPSIRTALLLGFSPENHDGFSDRIENQVAILSSLIPKPPPGAGESARRGRRGTASPPQAAVVKATARAPSEASLLQKMLEREREATITTSLPKALYVDQGRIDELRLIATQV